MLWGCETWDTDSYSYKLQCYSSDTKIRNEVFGRIPIQERGFKPKSCFFDCIRKHSIPRFITWVREMGRRLWIKCDFILEPPPHHPRIILIPHILYSPPVLSLLLNIVSVNPPPHTHTLAFEGRRRGDRYECRLGSNFRFGGVVCALVSRLAVSAAGFQPLRWFRQLAD